jgi:hypothetical protein
MLQFGTHETASAAIQALPGLARLALAVVASACGLLAAACSSAEETPAPAASPTPSPALAATATVPPATAVVVPPTATPTSAPPSATPEPTATPAPSVPEAASRATALLIGALGVPASTATVTEFSHFEWANAGLGCPEPGVAYAEVVTPGWMIVISVSGVVYEFHTDESGENLINCTELRSRFPDVINLADAASLFLATSVTIRRRDGASGQYLDIARVTDPSEVSRFKELLDIDMPLSPSTACTPVFQVVVHAGDRAEVFDYICPDDYRMVRGAQSFWQGRQARVPTEFGNLVGKYVSNQALPMLPDK